MSSSSSDSGAGAPSDDILEEALIRAVKDMYKSEKLEDLTIKRVRKAAELDLELEEDFYKSDEKWKEKSRDVISKAVDEYEREKGDAQSSPLQKKDASSPPKKPTAQPKPRGLKRKSEERKVPRKRQKQDSDAESSEEAEEQKAEAVGSEEEEVSKKVNIKKPNGVTKESPEDLQRATEPLRRDESESEMSVLIDEEPKRRGKRRKSTSAKPTKSERKSKKAAEQILDPEQDEIKRLQGWLVKCGIRKMWFKELAPYPAPNGKIRHLKKMLSDAGMTGRYSQEKANQIREERELKADLEAVQEGNKYWGKKESGDEEDVATGRPRRRIAKGLQGLDFLNDDDGEETD